MLYIDQHSRPILEALPNNRYDNYVLRFKFCSVQNAYYAFYVTLKIIGNISLEEYCDIQIYNEIKLFTIK